MKTWSIKEILETKPEQKKKLEELRKALKYEEFKKQLLRNPETKKEYDKLKPIKKEEKNDGISCKG